MTLEELEAAHLALVKRVNGIEANLFSHGTRLGDAEADIVYIRNAGMALRDRVTRIVNQLKALAAGIRSYDNPAPGASTDAIFDIQDD